MRIVCAVQLSRRKAGPRKGLEGVLDLLEPVQVAVQILRGDTAKSQQNELELAVAVVDGLEAATVPHAPPERLILDSAVAPHRTHRWTSHCIVDIVNSRTTSELALREPPVSAPS